MKNNKVFSDYNGYAIKCRNINERIEICSKIKTYGFDIANGLITNNLQNYLTLVIYKSSGLDAYSSYPKELKYVSKKIFLRLFLNGKGNKFTIYGEKIN